MRFGKWIRLIAASAPIALAGCGNFWQAPNGTGSSTCTTNCPTTTSGNFYILNQATNQIAGYNIASGGTLTAITGSPYALAAKPFAIAIAPGGAYLYVSTTAGIYLYTVDSTTGELTLGNSNNVISSDYATALQMDSTGAWLVEAGPDLAELVAISIDPTTGLLATSTEQTATLPATTVEQLTISPDNANVFVALGTSGTAVVPFDATNTNPFGTTLTKIPVNHTGGSALSVAVDPTTRAFYVGETLAGASGSTGGLRVFNYSTLTTTLTEETGSPYATGGLAPNAILPDSSGDYVYVGNGQGTTVAGNVAEFTVASTATTFTLTAGSTAALGTDPRGLAEDSTNTYVLAVASGGSPDLSAFTFDTTTLGKLDSVLTASTGTDPVQAAAIAAAPQ